MTHSVRTNTSVLMILLRSPEGWEYAAVLVLVSDPPPTRTPQTYRITIRDTTSCQRNDTGNLKDRPGCSPIGIIIVPNGGCWEEERTGIEPGDADADSCSRLPNRLGAPFSLLALHSKIPLPHSPCERKTIDRLIRVLVDKFTLVRD